MTDENESYETMTKNDLITILNGLREGNHELQSKVRSLEEELLKKEQRFEDITGLWFPKRESTKVAYEGRTREDLEIPKGSKVIAFYNKSDSEGSPNLNLVWVVNEN